MKVNDILQKAMSAVRNEGSDKINGTADYKMFDVSSTRDRVSISSLINYLNQSMTSEKADQASNDRVAALKALIETGKYTISGQAVAGKMLAMIKE